MNPSFFNLSSNSGGASEEELTQEFNTTCPVFEETGECKHGFKCRFLGGHAHKDEAGNLVLIQDEEKIARSAVSAKELNFMSPDTLKLLRSKKVRHIHFLQNTI
jgi:tRNA-dihydrouridine synthase 3